jgi:Fe-S cluster assembly protein SufD
MQLINNNDITLVPYTREELNKVNLKTLAKYEFKNKTIYTLDHSDIENNTTLTIDASTKKEIVLVHHIKEDDTFYEHSLEINITNNIEVSLVEIFVNTCNNSLYKVNRELNIGDSSIVNYVKIQDINEANYFLYEMNVTQKDNSKVQLSSFEYGNAFIINRYENNLNSKHCDYETNFLVKTISSSNVANIVRTVHNDTHNKSSINCKHALKNASKAVFNVKSLVNNTALFTEAYQDMHTILLDNDSSIFISPHLEIKVDELKASHGTSTGGINEDELLYLQTRGISKAVAYEMLLEAFIKNTYDNINDESVKEFVVDFNREDYV